MDNVLSMLGLAKKAGLIEIGSDSVKTAARAGRAVLVMASKDSSPPSKKRAQTCAAAGGAVYLELPYDKYELGSLLGRGSPGTIAVTDVGFAASFAAKLDAACGGYGKERAELESMTGAGSKRAQPRTGKPGACKRRTKS